MPSTECLLFLLVRMESLSFILKEGVLFEWRSFILFFPFSKSFLYRKCVILTTEEFDSTYVMTLTCIHEPIVTLLILL